MASPHAAVSPRDDGGILIVPRRVREALYISTALTAPLPLAEVTPACFEKGLTWVSRVGYF